MITRYIKMPLHIPNYKIATDCDKLAAFLCLQYGEYINNVSCDNFLEISVYKQGTDNYIVKYQDKNIITDTPLQEVNNILFSNTSYDDSVLALHGAAVEWHGKSYLFLASTTSGKTTLASYLTSTGFEYITDDCILLDKNNMIIHPYNCPIHLREGGLKVLRQYNLEPPNLTFLNDIIIKRYIYTPNNCIKKDIPLGQIYFIERNENENKVVDMATAESIAALMKAPMIAYPITGEYIRLISKLAKTGCKRLFYKDMQFVSDIIKLEE